MPNLAMRRYMRRSHRSNVTTPPFNPSLPEQPTLWSEAVRRRYGLNGVFNQGSSVYRSANASAIFTRLEAMGVHYVRGLFDQGNANCIAAANAARAHGIKWMMIVVQESSTEPTAQTTAQTTTRVNYIADNYADICHSIEGLNEPNQNRGPGTTTSGWQTVAYNHQVAIWNACKGARNSAALGAVPVIGPSLHDTKAAQNNGAHYTLLANTGIADYMDYLGMHRYPGGWMPENNLDQRLGLVSNAFGAPFVNAGKVVLTEWGYHNALATTSGHLPTDEATSDVYGVRGIFAICGDRGLPIVRFELLDDYDAAPKNEQEANFGLVRVPTSDTTDTGSWTEKPEYGHVSTTLNALKDTGSSYTVTPARFSVSTTASDVRWVTTQKHDGASTVWIWRDLDVWNPSTETTISVSNASVTITDSVGPRTISVGPAVTSLALR